MSSVWELDFYSRPILDEQQKKIWELLVCDAERKFEYSKFCGGSEANARWLEAALKEAIALWQETTQQPPQAVPAKIRFFRRQMTNIITRGCEAIAIPAQPSRRTFALYQWLQERRQTVYAQHPGYQPLAAPPIAFDLPQPQPLPDALTGQQWQFVALEVGAFQEMDQWEIAFGEGLSLNTFDLEPNVQIPGMIIFSPRAVALAAWMSGLELAFLKVETDSLARLLLETGISDRWVVTNFKTPQLIAEAEAFEAAKQRSQQVHFLAIQSDPQAENFAGFWLLREGPSE